MIPGIFTQKYDPQKYSDVAKLMRKYMYRYNNSLIVEANNWSHS